MHGLFNRSLQCFLTDTYGSAAWRAIARRIDLDPAEFEALLIYEDSVTADLLAAASDILMKPVDEILEDAGTFLVSHPSTEAVRRLLRFGGDDFTSFLYSLNDLPDRARMAMPDLHLPRLRLAAGQDGTYVLLCRSDYAGYCHVTLGALRAMADDYGALVSLDLDTRTVGEAEITIRVYDTGFTQGRSFALGLRAS